MKKGINFWSFSKDISLEEGMKMAKDAGFEGIEFCMNESGELGLDTSKENMRAIKNKAQDIGLEINSIASWLPWEYSLTSGNPDHRIKAKEIVRKQIEIANLLGADTVLVVPGYVGVDFIANSEVCRYDRVYDRAFEAIKELSKEAEEANVNIGVENVWNKFLLSPLEMRDFVDKIESPYVGVYFDVGNVLLTGYPEHWIEILGFRIKKVHFKDYRREPGGFGSFVDLLAGDVNYPAVVDALDSIGYEGYCNAEMMPPYTHYPSQIIYNTSAAMDRILKKK